MNLLIRKAIKSDLSAILNLYATVLDKGDVLSVSQATILFDKMKCYPNYEVYVALIEQQTVGTFALLIMDNLAHQGTPSAIVEDVVVAENYQQQGIGKAMMQYAMEQARTYNCYKMVLSSNLIRSNAHAFYEQLDFQKHGFSFYINP
jgi:GNAT superfamily N-acetyltransferase